MMWQRRITSKRVAAGLAVGVAALIGTVSAGPGSATAGNYYGGMVDMRCVGPSPQLVDSPYTGTVQYLQRDARSGFPAFSVNSGSSVWGYGTHPTLHWTNLNTRASGTLAGHGAVSPFFGDSVGVYFPEVRTGAGLVRIDLTVVNTGLAPVPPATCSGIATIR